MRLRRKVSRQGYTRKTPTSSSDGDSQSQGAHQRLLTNASTPQIVATRYAQPSVGEAFQPRRRAVQCSSVPSEPRTLTDPAPVQRPVKNRGSTSPPRSPSPPEGEGGVQPWMTSTVARSRRYFVSLSVLHPARLASCPGWRATSPACSDRRCTA